MPAEAHRLSIAPMMDRTDRHYRFFMRCITKRTLLYTEMITTGAIQHGNRSRLLGYDPSEHPVALQLGGDDPKALAECARIAADLGYDEIDLNVGCPSDRVKKGCFGAVLMRRPEHVAECIFAMRAAVSVPVTVKHRIGVDELDRYEDLARFVAVVAEAKPARFTVHARKAWLQGLSPKENRTVPPLRYSDVHRLKADFPDESIEINGGILTLDQATAHLDHVDAVMIGRAAVDDPYLFAEADQRIYGETGPSPSREHIVREMAEYVGRIVSDGNRAHYAIRHMLNLYKRQPGARGWRRYLTEGAQRPDADEQVLLSLLDRA